MTVTYFLSQNYFRGGYVLPGTPVKRGVISLNVIFIILAVKRGSPDITSKVRLY